MNYRHLYHAGNFADVIKHVLLVEALKLITQKDAPLLYLETHAGAGSYDLSSTEAQKSAEWKDGIGRFYEQQTIPEPLASYASVVHKLNEAESTEPLRWYPGSPWFVREFLRKSDRLCLAESEAAIFAQLKKDFGAEKSVELVQSDGFELLKKELPPKEKRALVLIDPPYESKADWDRIPEVLSSVLKRCAGSTFIIWYPVKNDSPLRNFKFELLNLGPEKAFEFEFSPYSEELPGRLNGCGLVVLGSPWKLDERMKDVIFPHLRRVLTAGAGRVSVRKLGH